MKKYPAPQKSKKKEPKVPEAPKGSWISQIQQNRAQKMLPVSVPVPAKSKK